jgi:alpha-N-arabinofuranosidase
VSWTVDGWPIIGHGGHVESIMDSPTLSGNPWPLPAIRDNFDDTALGFDWTFLRNPVPESWSLREHPGHLTLRGTKVSLDAAGAPAFVGRRLRHLSCDIAASLDFEPKHEGEESGLTVFMNERYHYDLAVKLKEGRKAIVLRRTVGSMRTESTLDCAEGPIVLKIEARPESFVFSVQQAQSLVELGSGEAHLLSTEVAGGFTGIFIAMYAVSEAESSTPALFDWFDYEPVGG